MRKILMIAALLSLPLSACATIPEIPPAAPAPLAKTVIDDKALDTAWRAFDVTLDAINILIDRKVLVPGTPKAVKIANAIDRTAKLLAAAEKAADAGSTTDYGTAMIDAKGAFVELRAALGEM